MDELKHLRELEDTVTAKEEVVESCKKDLADAKKDFDAAVTVLREAIRQTKGSDQLELPISLDTTTVKDAQYEVVDESHQLPAAPKSLNANRGLPWEDPPTDPTLPPNPPAGPDPSGPAGNQDDEG